MGLGMKKSEGSYDPLGVKKIEKIDKIDDPLLSRKPTNN